ncbi:MAG: glutamate decarboxylase [Saccharospirillaceae bacterium]|nr:pyridoxal-dependent decarboxylase [Pseudomonadales bacterium]NRB80829.1 glutamate decarboxylase [Saccharospirillaceae bacterium]
MSVNNNLSITQLPWALGDKQQLISKHLNQLKNIKRHFLGYQTNQNIEISETISPFLNMNVLNLGDAFENGDYQLNAKEFERAILQYYARLYHLDSENSDSQEYWGYLTTMGSTEGNLCALWNAREYLSQNFNKPPVVLYSKQTHYSIHKACRLLQLPNIAELGKQLGDCPIDNCSINQNSNEHGWPQAIPTQTDGSIDINALFKVAKFFIDRGYPIIFNFNYGTTFNGAFDDIELAMQRLKPLLYKNTNKRNYWLHVDGALAANYMPFIEQGLKQGLENNTQYRKEKVPIFDFRIPEVMSISVSPYKWIGAPWPYGIFMTRKSLVNINTHRPHYIGSNDTTISGSRNGFSAIMLWDKLTKLGQKGLIDLAFRNEKLTQYAHQKISDLIENSTISAETILLQPRVCFSNIILFRSPNRNIINQFSLCSDWHDINGISVLLSHIVILEHVTFETIDYFIEALQKPDAFSTSFTKSALDESNLSTANLNAVTLSTP